MGVRKTNTNMNASRTSPATNEQVCIACGSDYAAVDGLCLECDDAAFNHPNGRRGFLRAMRYLLAGACIALAFSGCAPTVYERASAVYRGENVVANERALQHENYLAPGAHVRCGR